VQCAYLTYLGTLKIFLLLISCNSSKINVEYAKQRKNAEIVPFSLEDWEGCSKLKNLFSLAVRVKQLLLTAQLTVYPPPHPAHRWASKFARIEPFIFLILIVSHTLLVNVESPILPSHTYLASA
jgi:hypothetical protein